MDFTPDPPRVHDKECDCRECLEWFAMKHNSGACRVCMRAIDDHEGAEPCSKPS